MSMDDFAKKMLLLLFSNHNWAKQFLLNIMIIIIKVNFYYSFCYMLSHITLNKEHVLMIYKNL